AMTEAADLERARQARDAARDAVRDLQDRIDNAQQLADMGDYAWHVPTDTNTWSDQLYRIFGYEPQSQHMDYSTYMAHCHPDDREPITVIHQNTYATGEPFTLAHRIVRPDGEVRHLLCNGEVVNDSAGQPVLMRGTAVDITARVLAEEERERQAARAQTERMRRQAALEINDNVVQGLTAALYALELDDTEKVTGYVHRTLDAARTIISGLVGSIEGPVEPGDLVRSGSNANGEGLPSP
ncbi:MAG: PAS domain-containing protein, partial [Nocardioides sp.]